METFTLTYKQGISKSIVLQSLDKRLESSFKEDMLPSCCGSLAYLSLFLLPEFELEDKKVYSIENVCSYVPGIFTMFMHDTLTFLGRVAMGINVRDSVGALLSSAGFYECFKMLGVVPKEWYRVFLFNYMDGKVSLDQLQGLQTYDSLVTLFYNMSGETA